MGKGWLVGIFAALSMMNVSAHADPKRIVMGVEELSYLPAYAFENGGYTGAAADIFRAFARDQGVEIVFKPLPIKRLYAETFRGEVDLKFPDSPDWVPDLRATHPMSYSKPVIHYVDGVMVRMATKGKGIGALKSLGTVQGFTLVPELKAQVDAGKIEFKENPKLDQLLRQVVVGRIDGAYVSVAGARYLIASQGEQLSGLAFDPALPYNTGTYQMSTATHPELIAAFDAWAAQHEAEIQGIIKKWGAEVTVGR